MKGGSGSSPLWNEIIDQTPPPAPAREFISPWYGRGRGQGVGTANLAHPAGKSGGMPPSPGQPAQNPGAPFSGGIFLARGANRPGAPLSGGIFLASPATDRARASVYFGQLGEACLQLLVGGDVVGHHAVVELLVGGHVEVPGARQAEDDGLGLAGLLAL